VCSDEWVFPKLLEAQKPRLETKAVIRYDQQ